MSNIVHLTDNNFSEEVLSSEIPVLVDFWASWCPPCKVMEPVIEEIAATYNGRLKVGALHVDQNRQTASRYHILGVPTLILFEAGEAVERRTGAQSKGQIARMLAGLT